MVENLRQGLNPGQVRMAWQGLTQTDKLNIGERERVASVLIGGLLALFGLGRLSLTALGLALGGAYLVYRGLTGHCLAYKALDFSTARSRLRFDDEYHEQPESTIDTDDGHDETVWETFPASDSPSTW